MTLPAATLTTSSPMNLSQDILTGANAKEDSPLVEIDPLNPLKMVAVWVNNDTLDIPLPGPQVLVTQSLRSMAVRLGPRFHQTSLRLK